jgi:hypothetical protein
MMMPPPRSYSAPDRQLRRALTVTTCHSQGGLLTAASGQIFHRRAEGLHLVPGHADGEAGSLHRGGERLDLIAAEIVAFAHELLTPLLPHVLKQLPVAVDDPDRLLEDGRDDSFRRQLAQLQDERAADAAGTRVSSRDSDSATQPTAGPPRYD